MHQYSTLTNEQEKELAMLIASGNSRALDKLILANQGFVISTAKQYQGKGVDLDDLVSEGNIAIMMAAPKWDPEKEPRFVKYAVWHIRRAMEQALERQGNVIRVPENETKNVRSMDAPLRPGHNRSLGESMPQRGVRSIGDKANDATITLGLQDSLYVLNERERMVITNYYGLGTPQLNMAEIGIMMGLKRERIRQIRKRAERRLRKPLKGMEA